MNVPMALLAVLLFEEICIDKELVRKEPCNGGNSVQALKAPQILYRPRVA